LPSRGFEQVFIQITDDEIDIEMISGSR